MLDIFMYYNILKFSVTTSSFLELSHFMGLSVFLFEKE